MHKTQNQTKNQILVSFTSPVCEVADSTLDRSVKSNSGHLLVSKEQWRSADVKVTTGLAESNIHYVRLLA